MPESLTSTILFFPHYQMPELMAPEDVAGFYSHFHPQNIPQTKIKHIFLFVCLYNKGLTWWILSSWSVLNLMVSAKIDLWRKCCARKMLFYCKEECPCPFFSDDTFIQTTESWWYSMEATSPPDTSWSSCSSGFWQRKKPNQIKSTR